MSIWLIMGFIAISVRPDRETANSVGHEEITRKPLAVLGWTKTRFCPKMLMNCFHGSVLSYAQWCMGEN